MSLSAYACNQLPVTEQVCHYSQFPLTEIAALDRSRARGRRGYTMKALILYVIFVTIGALIAGAIGYYVEIQVSATASLIVFLALFFANFAVSWIAVILIMDGSLRDAQGRQAQLDIERAARR
jgi:hypothetical protein